MANYNLTTVRPKGFIHSSAFAEVKDSLAWALTQLGHSVNLTENAFSSAEATNIIFGCELLSPQTQLPRNSIVYNFEQPSHPNIPNVKKLAKGLRVWDYSPRNVSVWKREGIDVDAHHVPVGYTPNLTRIPKATDQDIDVCFMGWLTPRRVNLIEDLKKAGLKVFASDKCYGGARDNILSRSKIVLNVHHDGRDMFEIVRVSYLLANSKAVVTEESSDDSDYQFINGTVCRSRYSDLVENCLELTRESIRVAHEDAAMHFSKQDYVQTVARALDGDQPVLDAIQKKFDDASSSLVKKAGEVFTNHSIRSRYERGCQEGDMKDFLPWIRAHAKGNCLEIGVRDGASTSAFLLGLEERGGHLMSFDIADCSDIWTHPQWTFNKQNSLQISFPDSVFDMALIDGDHSQMAARGDLYNCYYWVKPGGLILMHDILPERGHEWYSIALREEFFRFAKEKNLRTEELPGRYGMGILYR